MLRTILLIYIIAISVISVIVCCYDKFAAKHITRHRTRESSLLLFSALGGSVAMLITMLIIRHKTKHAKFMVGIPIIIIIQAAAVFLLFKLL
ncbi:MAG: DUF1294 domain-containing protein [Clostridia bacterium]|nr:DUF1294 domain-containing protein [Clostridia bacterium]